MSSSETGGAAPASNSRATAGDGMASSIERWFGQFDGPDPQSRQRSAARIHQPAINMAFGIGADEWDASNTTQVTDSPQTLRRTVAVALGLLLTLLIGIQIGLSAFDHWTDDNRSPRSLGGAFTSRTSEGVVRAELLENGYAAHAEPMGGNRLDAKREPQHGVRVLTVDAYRFNAFPGTLTLHFYKDQLMTVAFKPDDGKATSGGTRSMGNGPFTWHDKAVVAEALAASASTSAL